MERRVGLPRVDGLTGGLMAACLVAVWAPPATAQDAPPKAPGVIVIAFEDLPDGRNCDEAAARVGRCVEEVQFRDVDDLFKVHRGEGSFERLRTYGRLYGWIWDDLARRWSGDDLFQEHLVAVGLNRMPESSYLWDATPGADDGRGPAAGEPTDGTLRSYGVPARDLWVDGSRWLGTGGAQPPIYRTLDYAQAPGLVRPAPIVMLKGRFATRLVFDGRRHQFDIMDGDPETSGPFFEQMYPYEQAMGGGGGGDDRKEQNPEDEYFPDNYSSGDDSWWEAGGGGGDWGAVPEAPLLPAFDDGPVLEDDGFGFEQFGAYRYDSIDDDPNSGGKVSDDIPLSHFLADEAIKTPPRGGWSTDEQRRALVEARRASYAKTLLPLEASIEDLRSLAHDEFDNFYENVGTQIVRFAREEYTPTHLRVLTALMAMHDPPGTTSDARGLTKEAVAASIGQLDSDAALMAEASAAFVTDRAFSLNYKELPKPVVEKRLEAMDIWQNPDRRFLLDLTRDVGTQFKLLLRPRVSPIGGVDDDTLKAWAEQNAQDSRRAAFILKYIRPIALEVAVRRLGEERGKTERDRIETSLILDHVRYEYVSRFTTDPAQRQTPGELEAMGAEQWVAVLRRHGFYSNFIADGPGAVDPLAICTTLDRQAALAQPAFGQVNVDGLIVAPDGLMDSDAILWHGRDQLPFLLIDDPRVNRPSVLRLVSLPGERAIYRIRWKVWTGWHLLWAPEPVSVQDQEYRLALRTAAICDDTVLAPPRIVPTLIRAALLDGDFRPVNAIQGDGTDAVGAYYEKPTNQELYDSRRDDVDKGTDAAQTLEKVDTDRPVALVTDTLGLAQRIFKKKEVRSPVEVIRQESVRYVRDLVAEPLRAEVKREATVLVVLDESQVRDKRKIHFNKPRAPYLMARSREGDGYRYAGAWAYFLPPAEAAVTTRTMLAPAYLPTQSVASNSMVQKWTRRQTGDWAFSAGIGAFPLRRTISVCAGEGSTKDTVVDCSQIGTGDRLIANTSGLSLDVTALRTLWRSSYDRYAIEFGPEFHLDMVFPGKSIYDDVPITYPLAITYAGGFLAGIRFGPPANPIAVKAGSHPWGADRPDGSSFLGRTEFGFRVGGLIGPSYNGLQGTIYGEGWSGWSMRRKRAKDATYTPYHPAILLGPYVRVMHTRMLMPAADRYYTLESATGFYAGVRIHFRLNGSAAGDLPEGQ